MINSKKRSSDSTGSKPKKVKTENTKSPSKVAPKKFSASKPGAEGAKKDFKKNIPGKTFGKPNKFAGGKDNKFTGSKDNKFNNKNKGKGNEESKPEEKTDWQKLKKEKKELRLKRKQGKDSFEVSVEAKKLYEKLKCKKSENKNDLVAKLYTIVSGDMLKKFVMAHDTARIIQCMLKFASPPLREKISHDLMSISVEMATSKYAHFCILRMFKYGSPKTKQNLVESFYGNIVKLASHNISHKILDHAYLSVATENQKAFMRQEFYGDLYKNTKDNNVKTLGDCYKETEQMKVAILGSVKSNLEHIANKNLVDNSLVHSVLLEYLKEIEDEEKKEEIINIYGPLIPHLLTTRDGCSASIECFYHSPAKNRRAIVKAIKEHLVKICIHEHGHLFFLSVLNSMDDTKAIKKSLFDPIYENIEEIIVDKWGRRVIEWFIAPAEKDFIHPHMLKILDEGLKFGKKDKDLRRKEIQEQVEGPLSESIQKFSKLYLKDGHVGLFTASILNKLNGDNFQKAAVELAKVICDEEWTVECQEQDKSKNKKKDKKTTEEETTEETSDEIKLVSGIEDAGMHIALKKILKKDSERETESFGEILLNQLKTDVVKKWITSNRGCFVLVNILQNKENLKENVNQLLKDSISYLKKESTVGSKVLREKLNI